MASTTAEYNPGQFSQPDPVGEFGVAASTLIHEGHMCAVASDGSGIVEPATPAANRRFAGVSTKTVDNSAGSAGDLKIPLITGDFAFDMKSGDTFDDGDVGAPAYVDTSTTVKKTQGSNSIQAGIVRRLAADGRVIIRTGVGA
jgi:hypothetical protein